MTAPLILSLAFDRTTFDVLSDLRNTHFPPERNIVPAHVTLFHALPGEHEHTIAQTLHDACLATAPMVLAFPRLRFLGRGVAIDMHCPPLLALRRQLAEQWAAWLSPQDKQRYSPHVTIQNKVSHETAHGLFDQLEPAWQPFEGTATGLLLWRYLNGPWQQVARFDFAAQEY